MDETTGNLLIVDDNAENRDMLSRRLARKGYSVLLAEDGPTALDLVSREPVDLVLLDIMMPGMDGLEVLQELRREHGQVELPVIMVTAKDDSEDVVRALELGANDYVTKPVDFPVVLARVEKELRTRDGARASARRPEPGGEPSSAGVAPGAVLDGRYRLGEPLGSGNFGTVYRGHHLELDLPVAVKVLDTRVATGEDSLARFRAEGRSACRVQHPNAVTVLDLGVNPNGVAYMVMELLEGQPLSKELATWQKLSPRRVDEMLQPVCSVLATAHGMRVVHRDVKPENIFLQRRPAGETVKVLDFGIAKLVGEHTTRENLTAEGFILGTPAYMAPERLRNEPYDGASDVYSLGVMLFQMLTGRLPFLPVKGDPMALLMLHLEQPPPPPRDLEPSLPAAVEALVLECLAKDPGGRPSPDELARRFAEAVASLPAPGTRTASSVRFDDDERPTHLLEHPRLPRRRGWLGRLLDRVRGGTGAGDGPA